MTIHRKKNVNYDENEIEIDIELAPLISELWKRNINTMKSCQEINPGIAWIEFISGMDAEIFLNIVAQEVSEKSNSMYQRIIGMDNCKNHWEYDTHAFDTSMYLETDKNNKTTAHHTGKPRFIFPVSIYFPKSDIKKILKLIKTAPTDFEELCDEFYSNGIHNEENLNNLETIAEKILAKHKVNSKDQN